MRTSDAESKRSSVSMPGNWTKKPVSPASPKKDEDKRLSSVRSSTSLNDVAAMERVKEDKTKRKSMKGLFSRKKKAKTVVCVDADVPTLEQLSKIMEELSFFPMCFTSSLDAKQFLNENTASGAIALVLCSMMMPGLSGMQLLQECRSSPDEVTAAVPFLLLSSFSKGSAKMQEFQIKTSDGSTVDILIKPLVSGLVVKKVRELVGEKSKDKDPDAASPSGNKKSSLRGHKSPGVEHKSDSLKESQSKDPPRKVKSTPHIADVVSKSDGALVSGSVSFADAGQMRELASSAGAANGSPDVLRARSKTMSASGSPLNQRPTLKEGSSPSSRHSRKNSDPISRDRKGSDPPPVLHRESGATNSGQIFLDTVFSNNSTPSGNKNSAGPNWDELEDEDGASAAASASQAQKLSRRRTIHGVSKKKLV